MARKTKEAKSKAKRPTGKAKGETQATVDEFERAGMGIAPKE
jgi:hypothetical protein